MISASIISPFFGFVNIFLHSVLAVMRARSHGRVGDGRREGGVGRNIFSEERVDVVLDAIGDLVAREPLELHFVDVAGLSDEQSLLFRRDVHRDHGLKAHNLGACTRGRL